MKLREQQMNKKEWQEHSKWLDTFRGKTITSDSIYEEKKSKKTKEKTTSKKKNQWILL